MRDLRSDFQRLVCQLIPYSAIVSVPVCSVSFNLMQNSLYKYHIMISYYFAQVKVRDIVINPYVGLSGCVCVCVCVCLRAYLWNHWTDPHEILYADPLWPWLGPPLAALSYVLPVLWTMSRLAVMGATPKRGCCAVQRRP